MSDAKLGEQGIDGSDLNAATAACRAQRGSVYMVLSIRLNQRQCRKAVNDLLSGPGAGKALQQFLENEACRHDGL